MKSGGDATRSRLLLLTNTVQTGGMEEHVRLLAKDLDRDRFKVTVVFPDWPETNPFADRLRDVADHVEQITPDRRFGALSALREAWRLLRFTRQQRFDVAHLHSTTYSGQWLALIALRAAGLRRIFVTEHLPPASTQPAIDRLRRRLFGALVTGIVCVSEFNREAREKYFHTPTESTHVVVNGIDLSRFDEPLTMTEDQVRSEFGIADTAPIVGTAIRFEPGKGVEDLVDAFAVVSKTNEKAVLLMVGDGSLRSALAKQVDDHGLCDRVIFAGFVADPRALIAAMNVFVLPVPFGSASIGLLEAMAMSKPCIISFGGPGEAVEPGVNGYWAEPHQPESIAEHIVHLLDDEELQLTMGANARRRIETDFASQRVARELSDLYLDRTR